MFFEEVKRTEGSHDEKDIAVSPPGIERRLLTGPDHARAACFGESGEKKRPVREIDRPRVVPGLPGSSRTAV